VGGWRIFSPARAPRQPRRLGAGRGRSPLDLLVEFDRGRLPDLVPIRHARMLASPFAFLRGFDQAVGRRAAQAAVRVYRNQLARYAGMRALEVWYSRVDASEIIALSKGRRRRAVTDRLARAQHHTNLDALPRLTAPAGDGRRFLEDPPLLTHAEECHPGWVVLLLSDRHDDRCCSRRPATSSSAGPATAPPATTSASSGT
jgi:hypothetical protein